jgi:Ca-activated chloride channel family protein
MLKRIARVLFVLAVGCNAQKSAPPPGVATTKPDVWAQEEPAPPPPPKADRAEGRYQDKLRADAMQQAQTAGVLGSATGGFTTRSHFASGFDDMDMSGGVGGNTETYRHHDPNGWTDAGKDHLSTFSVDVDTASYTIARRKLVEGRLPPQDAVRVEEFVNYFRYGYSTAAATAARPFAVSMDAAPHPFNPGRVLLRVGVASKAKSVSERKAAHLVFLVDVSGSMQTPDKIELAKRALRILVDNLKDGDTVAMVTYAGDTRVVLPATGLDHKGAIVSAIEELTAGGSTAMASGIELAYAEAMKGLAPGAESRVIILSDGDANVGPTSHDEILKTIANKVKEGITLSTIGFGMGNYKDETMEQLADKGDGANFYIDSLSQAKRVFQEQLGSTLEVVAQDVKLQIDFDARQVARYRLVGYENRDLADADFRDDRVDAGEIGAGHQVTAIYELELRQAMTADLTPADALAVVRVRHKEPKGISATEAAFGFDRANLARSFDAASNDFRFAFAAAAFADVLRGAEDAEHWDLGTIQQIAAGAAGGEADRKELVELIGKARAIAGGARAKTAVAE